MTPEQRFDRLERVAKLLVNSGRKARSEWRVESQAQAEKINILIHSQMETTEQIKNLALGQAELTEQVKSLAFGQAELTEQIKNLTFGQAELTEQTKSLALGQIELTNSQKRTDQMLRAFIDGLRKGRNGESSN